MAKSTNVIALIAGGWLAFGCSGQTAGDKTADTLDSSAGNGGSGGTSAAGTGGVAGSGLGGEGGTTRVPKQHRAVAEQCDRVRPTPDVPPAIDGGFASMCQSHAECTAGDNGRCTPARIGWICTYDGCFQDSDCPSADGGNPYAVCQCGGMGGAMGADNNVCLSGGNCRTDSDCGKGHCSPTFGSCGNYTGVIAYYCHVPEDECIDDADCRVTDAGVVLGAPYCAYAPAVGHWKCSSSQCVG